MLWERCHKQQRWWRPGGRLGNIIPYTFSCQHKKPCGMIWTPVHSASESVVETYPICDDPFSRSTRHRLAPLQKPRRTCRNHGSLLWTEACCISDRDFLPVYELSVVLWTQPWGEGWGGYMSSLVLRRLHEFGRFISIACSSTRAQLHTFLCLAQLHASSLCIDCISSVFSAEGATRKLMLQRLPTIG